MASLSVLIYGAGSIGNHLAHAARQLNYRVSIFDIDEDALHRTKNQIYPDRYGAWDEEITLITNESHVPNADLVIIGTPPDLHIPIALKVVKKSPKAILIEKPLSGLDLSGMDILMSNAVVPPGNIFVGYDHVLSKAVQKIENLLTEFDIGKLETIDVEFREHWGGIFAAHPWLSGPEESYLGYSHRGGGALAEHSHALNLWQHLSRLLGAGKVQKVQAMMEFVKTDSINYDKIAFLNLKTESGMIGRCVQDVVTSPPSKTIKIQGDKGSLSVEFSKNSDRIILADPGVEKKEIIFEKTRPDDFIAELSHIADQINGNTSTSPIAVKYGLETMAVIKAAHESATLGKALEVNYEFN